MMLHIDDLDGDVTLFKSTDEGTETIAVFDEEHRQVIQDLLDAKAATFTPLPYATIYNNDTAGDVWVNPNHVSSIAPYRKEGLHDPNTTNLRMMDGSWLLIALPPEEVVSVLIMQPRRTSLKVEE